MTSTGLNELAITLLLMLSCSFANAEINNNKPPLSLTIEQLAQWHPVSGIADKRHISRVKLQPRLVAHLGHRTHKLDEQVKVLIAPDGMNNLANYLTEQPVFNLYNFTHWSHIDVLNWFAGTANETVSLPARPWVEVAHKNGVKVIGTVYLSVAQYGGNIETVEKLVQQDEQGRFVMAHQLVDIAKFYGFDGWLINPETDLTRVKDAQGQLIPNIFQNARAEQAAEKVQQFMIYLTELAPNSMEIHWYDAMLLDGSVKWQNQLNEKNAPFFQIGKQRDTRVSDAMFLNYWWNESMVKQTHAFAKALNRSPYDVYFGVDLSPARNAQRIYEHRKWLDALFTENLSERVEGADNLQSDSLAAMSSIALFANDVNFTFDGSEKRPAISHFKKDADDYQRFYDGEVRLFAGDDRNLYHDDLTEHWPGIGRYVPAKTTITTLPFVTHFNTGHGRVKAVGGQISETNWHDVSQQELLPTWQFAIDGDLRTSVYYDFNDVYQGGTALAIRAPKQGSGNYIPLYQTALKLTKDSTLSVTFKHLDEGQQLWLILETQDGDKISLALVGKTQQWVTRHLPLASYADQIVQRIALKVTDNSQFPLVSNIGRVAIH